LLTAVPVCPRVCTVESVFMPPTCVALNMLPASVAVLIWLTMGSRVVDSEATVEFVVDSPVDSELTPLDSEFTLVDSELTPVEVEVDNDAMLVEVDEDTESTAVDRELIPVEAEVDNEFMPVDSDETPLTT
jgi:hypothetical protein